MRKVSCQSVLIVLLMLRAVGYNVTSAKFDRIKMEILVAPSVPDRRDLTPLFAKMCSFFSDTGWG
jgi:hypothetical protein